MERGEAPPLDATITVGATSSSPSSSPPPGGADGAGARRPPASIANYRIIRELGQGGMGVVYEAEQQEPRRVVALKVIRGGAAVDDAQVRMFQREVESLARLRHPHIGAIHEAGRTADGLHWFAMELVRGRHLDAYIASRRAVVTPAELQHRLRLVAGIARAVHYAHQRGVVHRDLKPSNIVVCEAPDGVPSLTALPEVKILDFGLARLGDEDLKPTEALTVAGAIKGTLAYMSPEQARGETGRIDVRTDVYALGMLLYEVLTEKRPYDLARGSLFDAVRVISEEPPRPLAVTWSGTRKLDDDVETIVMKALEKDPERRYGSAAAFADDIERYLASQPIAARPPSVAYQARKFAQRHRPLVLGAAATSLAVVAGLVVSTALYVRAERERQSAQQVATLLSSMLEGVGAPVAQGRDTTLLRDILDRTAERVGAELGGAPLIEARLRGMLGSAFFEIADFERAGAQWTRALELYRAARGDGGMDVAQQHADLGRLAEARSDYSRAEASLRRAVEIAHRADARDPRTPRFESWLAGTLVRVGRYEDARVLLEHALGSQRAIVGGAHADVAATLGTLGRVNHHLGRFDEAERCYGEALALHRGALGDGHPSVAVDLMNTAFLLDKRGRLHEAEALFRDALGRFRVLYPEGHDDVSSCLTGLASVLYRGEKFAEAEPLAREALAMTERIYGARSAAYARALDELAVLLAGKGDGRGADEAYARALAIRREILGPRHPDLAYSLNNLGMRKLDQGRFGEAETLIREAFELQRAAAGPDADTTLGFMTNLARATEAAGDRAAAEPLFREAIERRRRVLGRDSAYVAISEYYLSRMLRGDGRAAEAEPFQREAAAIMNASLGPTHLQTYLMELELAKVLTAVGTNDEAQRLARGVRARAAETLGRDSRTALDAGTVLAAALSGAGSHPEALALLDDVVARGAAVLSEGQLAAARIARGRALAGVGRGREGRAEIEAVRAAFAARYGRNHRVCRDAARELARLR